MLPNDKLIELLERISKSMDNNILLELLKTGLISFLVAAVSGWITWRITRKNTANQSTDQLSQQLLSEILNKVGSIKEDYEQYMNNPDSALASRLKLNIKGLGNLVLLTSQMGEIGRFKRLREKIDAYSKLQTDLSKLLRAEPFGQNQASYTTDERVEIMNEIQKFQIESFRLRIALLTA
jgi:hypothetical protein